MYSIDSWQMILFGIITGLVFGFLLQKAHVTRYQVILGQFLMKDFTVLKVMFTAIVVGAIGIWGMRAMGMNVPLQIKSATLVPNIVGGAIFGVGMALLGYCPGTGVAAIGDRSRHAIPGLIGMVVGGGIFAELYPSIQQTLMKSGDVILGEGEAATDKITLADLTALSPWWFIAGLAVVAVVIFLLLEKFGPKSTDTGSGSVATQA